jgi:transcriptional regulatory protein RtcR
MHADVVLIGFIDGRLEPGGARHRWQAWHQSMALAQREQVQVTRMELLHTRGQGALAERIRTDIAGAAPHVQVSLTPIDLSDMAELRAVQEALREWARSYPFDPQREQYWTPLCSDLQVAQLGLCLLLESPVIRGVMLQDSTQGPMAVGAKLVRLDAGSAPEAAPRRNGTPHSPTPSPVPGPTPVQAIGGGAFITRNARFAGMIEQIERVAMRSRAPVLLIGPTGVGKSMLARRMYDLKKAHEQLDGLFVEVNCATLRGDGTASALFGHKRGSFTGAASDRSGLLLTANRGLLFLDDGSSAQSLTEKMAKPLNLPHGFSDLTVDTQLNKLEILKKLDELVAAAPGSSLLSVAKYFCNSDTCSMRRGSKVLFRDLNHLNEFGSAYVAESLLRDNPALAKATSTG